MALHGLSRAHQRIITREYNQATIREQSLHHLRSLKHTFLTAMTAKREYHTLHTNILRDQLHVRRKTWQCHILHTETRQLNDHAKSRTVEIFQNSKTIHSLHSRLSSTYQRTKEAFAKQTRTKQAIYSLALKWAQWHTLAAEAINQRRQMFEDETRTIRQLILFHKKRPRDEWDPTLWEVPLRPTKRHKHI